MWEIHGGGIVQFPYKLDLLTATSEKKKIGTTVEVQLKFKRFLVDYIFISEFTKTKRAIKNERGGA